jgi:predicted DNA-binding protein with PD1-like motif
MYEGNRRSWRLRPRPGMQLEDAVVTLAAEHGVESAWVRAMGRISHVELGIVSADGSPRVCLSTEGVAELVSLDATLTNSGAGLVFRGTAVVAVDAAGVPVLRGGWLGSARVVEVDVMVTEADEAASSPRGREAVAPPVEVVAARPVAPRSVPPAVQAPPLAAAPARPAPAFTRPQPASAPAAAPLPAAPVTPDWGAVMAFSDTLQKQIEQDDEVDVDSLQKNDVLLHPALGRCRFLGLIGDDSVKVLLPNQSTRKLVLRVFKVVPDEGNRVFRLVKRD